MGNSNVSQHSRWRVVSADNSLVDLNEGQARRSSDVPNALICWENKTRRSMTGVWVPKPVHSAQPGSLPTGCGTISDFGDRKKLVGFHGDETTDSKKDAKRKRKMTRESWKASESLHFHNNKLLPATVVSSAHLW